MTNDLLKLNISFCEEIDKDTVYLISLANREEIIRGNYIEFNGLKISTNKRKFGIIRNIGAEDDK